MVEHPQAQHIRRALRRLAHDRGIEILFACESGSRAWDFASTDSDWDIRFIYRRPIDAYLQLLPGRDTLEHMEDPLDFAGWDFLKALRLAAKSNPALLEWLRSPIVYLESPAIAQLRDVMQVFDPRAVMHHYASLAERQVKAYWAPRKPVRFKKYLYALRPLLCISWMRNHHYQMPPISFHELRVDVALPRAVAREVDTLLRMKAGTTEIEGKGRFKALDRFIMEGIAESRGIAQAAPSRQPPLEDLQSLFLSTLLPARRETSRR